MPAPTDYLNEQETLIADDFRNNVGKVFQELHGDRWDETLWERSIARFESRHPNDLIRVTLYKLAGWESWAEVRDHFVKGPPIFVRDDWISPLIGQVLDLSLLEDESLEWIQGNASGWQSSQVLIIEFWATWCKPCHQSLTLLAQTSAKYGRDVKIIGINVEYIFGHAPPVNIPEWFRENNQERFRVQYPVCIDSRDRARQELLIPTGRLALPTIILLTSSDRVVRYVGSPNGSSPVLDQFLA